MADVNPRKICMSALADAGLDEKQIAQICAHVPEQVPPVYQK